MTLPQSLHHSAGLHGLRFFSRHHRRFEKPDKLKFIHIENEAPSLDKYIAAMQYYSMTALLVSKRGTITLPPHIRKKLGLNRLKQPMVLVEERDGGLFLQSAAPIPVREFSKEQMSHWVKEDEMGMEKLRTRKR